MLMKLEERILNIVIQKEMGISIKKFKNYVDKNRIHDVYPGHNEFGPGGFLQLARKQIYTGSVIMNTILNSKLYTRN